MTDAEPQPPPLADTAGPIPAFPPRALDPHGRLLPLSAAERRARSEAAVRALDALEAAGGDPDEDDRWPEAARALDAQRPHRPLFEGQY